MHCIIPASHGFVMTKKMLTRKEAKRHNCFLLNFTSIDGIDLSVNLKQQIEI